MPFSDISGVIPSNMADSLKFGPEWYVVYILILFVCFSLYITLLRGFKLTIKESTEIVSQLNIFAGSATLRSPQKVVWGGQVEVRQIA